MKNVRRSSLLASTILVGGLAISPAAAGQTTPAADSAPAQQADTPQTDPNAAQSTPADDAAQQGDIVVTGTLFRRTDTETPFPVTVLTADTLDRAGITNVADAVRSISADNSGSIPTAFAMGFGAGSAGVSLRGLSVNSTLVLIDGVRTTNYPFSDDGQRAFVDLNTIPKSTIDRIEVLKDGASSTYGADAIGGVVNIITRKEIQGIEGSAEAGTSERGDGGEQRLTLSAGYGDLSAQGFNVYLNGEYEHDGLILVSDRRFPFNSTDLRSIGGLNNNAGALGGFGGRIGTISAVVRPATQTTPGDPFSGVALPDTLSRVLSPTGCAAGTIAHYDPVTLEDGGAGGAYCEQNMAPYGTIQPGQKRYGFTAHATVKLGDNAEAYLAGTYYHSQVFVAAQPQTIRQTNPFNTTNIVLPALLSNGQRNPQDPYAAQGLAAQITYSFGDIPFSVQPKNDVYRIVGGLNGSFGDGWSYSFDAAYAKSALDNVQHGFLNVAGLIDAINTGSYNFTDPSLNSQTVRDSIAPEFTTHSISELTMAQGTLTKELLQLPGGALALGIGGSVRHEALNNPNANANQQFLNVNAVTASGKRTITAGYFELQAPILDSLEINASGRYDHYSDGFSHFSPKIGVKFTPLRQLALRGTFSKGFRAPSFAESQNGAVIGYITAVPPCSAVIAHGGTATADGCSGGDAYVQAYSLGLNSASNPDLKPEKSRSFTGGAILQPTRWLSMTVDYYNIRKTDVISGGPLAGAAVDAYYAGDALPPGYTVTLDAPDQQFPGAIRKVLTVNSPYANAASLRTSGIDASIQADFKFGADNRFISKLEGTEILHFDFKPSADAAYDHYVGTQAPYILSSGAGTPRWRANWQNSLQIGPFTLTGTAYYTSGYKTVAVDAAGPTATTCAQSLYGTGDTFCHTKGFFDLDITGQIKVNDRFTFYVNVVNALDAGAPLNPDNYAAVNYNPTWSQAGIIGRFVRAGASFKF